MIEFQESVTQDIEILMRECGKDEKFSIAKEFSESWLFNQSIFGSKCIELTKYKIFCLLSHISTVLFNLVSDQMIVAMSLISTRANINKMEEKTSTVKMFEKLETKSFSFARSLDQPWSVFQYE
jgi:hypothetical protein